jgi:SAM-dependent methyltransferase
MDITQSVRRLYETFPFPPDRVSAGPPPGWNWRWSWSFAHSFCLGRRPSRCDVRILDAGCGTGVGTEYLAHQNPQAQITAVDLSAASLEIARTRCARYANVEFAQMDLAGAAEHLSGPFDYINCVGVLHHMADPAAGLGALARLLAPGGLLHVFVYGALGRWEIHLMQEAIRLLRNPEDPLVDGLRVGRTLFGTLPEDNRLVRAERERWALENRDDACFVDMYVQVQEVRYTIPTLFDLIDGSELQFLGFSNPGFWSLARLLGRASDLVERAAHLAERERYRLIELLDPVVSHYEFFLGKPPLVPVQWTDDALGAAHPYRSPFINPWPAVQVFDHEYDIVNLNASEIAFLEAADGGRTVGELLAEHPDLDLAAVRRLMEHMLVQLA